MRVLVSLTPSESKRLIGRAVASLQEVKQAFAAGRLIVAGGTTNAYVAEEITGRKIEKAYYTAGIITDGVTCVTPPDARISPISYVKGKVSDDPWLDVLKGFTAEDVFIKGANAIDPDGNAGVLVAAPNGGTIGQSFGTVMAVGAHLIVPVGLEKLIPSVPAAVESMGFGRFDDAIGLKTGLIPVMGAKVITEIEALWELFGVEAIHVASGGVGGSEGAVVLSIEGPSENVCEAIAYTRSIKGEPSVKMLKGDCQSCQSRCDRAANRS